MMFGHNSIGKPVKIRVINENQRKAMEINKTEIKQNTETYWSSRRLAGPPGPCRRPAALEAQTHVPGWSQCCLMPLNRSRRAGDGKIYECIDSGVCDTSHKIERP